MLKQTMFIVLQKEEGGDRLIGGRLTLEAAISLCKLGPLRYWMKVVGTKELGSSRFDNNAKQQEKQHGTETGQSADAERIHSLVRSG
jgi:hypothetical protein